MDNQNNPWPVSFQHEKDQKAVSDIISNPEVTGIFEALENAKVDEVYHAAYAMSCIRITEKNAPEIRQMLEKSAALFSLEEVPDMYIVKEYSERLEPVGINHPFIVISSRYLEILCQKDKSLLYGVIASQAAAIRLNHHRAAILFNLVMNGLQYVNIPKVILMSLSAALNEWNKCRYLTYDRVVYLTTGDLALARENLMLHILPEDMLSKMNFDQGYSEYKEQYENFWGDSLVENLFQRANSMRYDTAWIPERYRELDAIDKIYRQLGGKV